MTTTKVTPQAWNAEHAVARKLAREAAAQLGTVALRNRLEISRHAIARTVKGSAGEAIAMGTVEGLNDELNAR